MTPEMLLEEYERLKVEYKELLDDYTDLDKQLRKANTEIYGGCGLSMRLIDANALLKKLQEQQKYSSATDSRGRAKAIVELIHAPTVDAVTVKRGHWNRDEMGYDSYVMCSECGLNLNVSDYEKDEWREILRFCQCCGADMRGGTDA